MERIAAAVTPKCFFINRNEQQRIMENKVITCFINILKDWLMLSVVIMAGAALTLFLG